MAANQPKPLAARFARFVHRTDDLFGCWLWTGRTAGRGYGYISRGRRREGDAYAHRVAWELAYGPIPDGLWVLHQCDTPHCVRPDHLFLGTHRDNMRDMLAKGRDRLTGERNHRARLTAEQVQTIRHSDESLRTLATHFGVAIRTIRDVRRRKNWKHVG